MKEERKKISDRAIGHGENLGCDDDDDDDDASNGKQLEEYGDLHQLLLLP